MIFQDKKLKTESIFSLHNYVIQFSCLFLCHSNIHVIKTVAACAIACNAVVFSLLHSHSKRIVYFFAVQTNFFSMVLFVFDQQGVFYQFNHECSFIMYQLVMFALQIVPIQRFFMESYENNASQVNICAVQSEKKHLRFHELQKNTIEYVAIREQVATRIRECHFCSVTQPEIDTEYCKKNETKKSTRRK